MLIPYIKKHDLQIREAIRVDKKLALVLHGLGFRNHVTKPRNYLGLSLASTFKFIHEVCEVSIIYFYKKYI